MAIILSCNGTKFHAVCKSKPKLFRSHEEARAEVKLQRKNDYDGGEEKMKKGGGFVSGTVPHRVSSLCGGSPSRDGDVAVYVFDINQPSLPTPFYSDLVSVSVFMALSTVFHSVNSPDNSPLSHSVLLVLFLPYRSFQLYISL